MIQIKISFMKLLFGISEVIGLVVDYLNLRENLLLYLACYERIQIFKYITTINYSITSPSSFLSLPSSSSTQNFQSSLQILFQLFFQNCFNIKNIFINYYFDEKIKWNTHNTIYDFELSQNLLSLLLTSFSYKKNKIISITILLPESSPLSFINLCSQFLLQISKEQNNNLKFLYLDLPIYRLDPLAFPLSFSIHKNCPILTEITGIEFSDCLFQELNFDDNNNISGFLDIECWSHLEILHLGNLINRYFSILEDLSSTQSLQIPQFNSIFLSKFSKQRFPNVKILDFNQIDSANLLNFFVIMTEFFLLHSNDSQLFIWIQFQPLDLMNF